MVTCTTAAIEFGADIHYWHPEWDLCCGDADHDQEVECEGVRKPAHKERTRSRQTRRSAPVMSGGSRILICDRKWSAALRKSPAR